MRREKPQRQLYIQMSKLCYAHPALKDIGGNAYSDFDVDTKALEADPHGCFVECTVSRKIIIMSRRHTNE